MQKIVLGPVACSSNRVIGKDGTLPWKLKSDLKLFKELTLRKPIIMGRKTWDSLPKKPLPNRPNIIVTSGSDIKTDLNTKTAKTLSTAINVASIAAIFYSWPAPEEICLIGGARVFEEGIALADKMYITEVHAEVEGDVFFPAFDEAEWKETVRQDYPASDKDEFAFTFRTLERIR